ncbi:MAG: hypothetical protein N2654_07795, partial [Deltaproteobacteria bacterium]|nr:hypothetical protein [Deltaproteobacteria bacterium]
ICSDPIEPFWEFLITVVQGGKVSGALANLSPGDFVFYKPTPKGTMTLERLNNHTTVVFVATGSGVGPFKPMILEILRSEQAKDMNLVLVQGARTISELHYRNLFEDLMTKHHKFKYLPYVSRENVGNSSLSAGRVTDFIKNSEFDPKSTLFYLCGNPTMIQDVKTILTEKGHITGKGGNVVTESYW